MITGGIYHLPAYLSPESKYLLSQMLIVDPVKRITISEIRQLPWFQTNLPRYLCPHPSTPSNEHGPPIGDLASLIAQDDPLSSTSSNGNRRGSQESTDGMDPEKEAAKRGWVYTYDLGVIDPKIVEELVGKMQGWKRDDLWDALKRDGDNQIKVAFQLVRDHRRMLKGVEGGLDDDDDSRAIESFLAVSPPAWDLPPGASRGRGALVPPGSVDEEEYDDDEDEDEIPDSNFAVLDTSLPGHAEGQ